MSSQESGKKLGTSIDKKHSKSQFTKRKKNPKSTNTAMFNNPQEYIVVYFKTEFPA